MKIAIAVLVVCFAACVLADGGYGGPNGGYGGGYGGGHGGYGYGYGLKPVGNGYAAPYNNAARQQYVNRQAEYVGSGIGTGYYGVPGTGLYFGYHGHGYNKGHGRY